MISLLLVSSCRCGDNGGELASAVPAPKPAPEPPPGLLADWAVGEPKAFWSQVHGMASGPMRTLPSNPELLLTNSLGLPALSAGFFDLTSAVVGVLLDRHPRAPALVLAVRVSSGRELVALLTSGAAPSFKVKSLASGYQVLDPVEADRALQLAVLNNHLVVSTDKHVEPKVARYLVENLAGQPAPAGALTLTSRRAELKGPVSKLLQARWAQYRQELTRLEREARAQQAGRAPDFADPAAVQTALGAGVDAMLELLDTSRQLRFSVAPGAQHWTLRLELEPEPRGTANDLVMNQVMGPAEPLKRLPAAAAVAVLAMSSGEQRSQGARETLAQLGQLFGARLDEPTRTRVGRVLQNLAAGRGDSMQAGLVLGQSPGIIAQGRVANADQLASALNELPQLLTSQVFSEPLGDWLGPVRVKAPPRHPFDGGFLLAFGPGGRFGKLLASGLASFWHVSDAEFHVSLGPPPGTALMQRSQKPEATLGDLAPVADALERVEDSSLVALIRTEVLGLVEAEGPPGAEGILTLNVGRHDQTGFLRVEVPVKLLQASITAAVQP